MSRQALDQAPSVDEAAENTDTTQDMDGVHGAILIKGHSSYGVLGETHHLVLDFWARPAPMVFWAADGY